MRDEKCYSCGRANPGLWGFGPALRKIGADLNGHRLLLRVNPDIARALKEEESAVVRDLKHTLGKDVTIKPDVQLHHEQFDVMAV